MVAATAMKTGKTIQTKPVTDHGLGVRQGSVKRLCPPSTMDANILGEDGGQSLLRLPH